MAEKIIGLDIGSGSLKAVALSRGFRGKHRILGARRIAISAAGGVPAALSELFADPAFRNAPCVTALPARQLTFRNVRLPFRDDKRIGQTLAFTLEPLIQQPLEEVFIDFSVTARAEGAAIFAALAERAQVAQRTELLASHARRTAVIDVESVPLASLLMQRPGATACCLLLDLGQTGATAVLAGQGRILQVRHFPFGGAAAAGAVAAALGPGTEGSPPSARGTELPPVAQEALREACGRFCAELGKTVAFLIDQGAIPEPPTRIVLAGGGSRMPGLDGELARRFNVAVERTNLLAAGGFEIPADLRPSWEPEIMDQALALAARPLGRGSGFNFHQRESEARADYGAVRSRLIRGAVAALVVLVLAGVEIGLDDYGARIRLGQIRQEIAAAFKRIDPETTRIVDPVVQLRARIAEAKKFAAGMGDSAAAATVLDLLREISALAPPDLLVTSLTLDGDAVGLKGEAKNFDAVDSVKKTFSNSKYFKTVTIGSTALMKQGTGVEFDLKVVLKR
jgi:general secretion pathway protein L